MILKDDVIVGNILTLTEQAWERLQVAISQRTALSEQARFEQTYLYPQVACREALINAIVHRDYSAEGRGIEVSLFSDRMEIVSPGALLSTVSLDEIRDLEGAHESRNPLIARVLREVGLVREMGEGIRRIFEVMRSSALAVPQLSTDAHTFKVSLFNRSLYEGGVQLWLSNFDHLDLDEQQRAVLALGYNGKTFSTQDVIDRLGLVDVDMVRVVMTPLRQSGAITRTLTDIQMLKESRRSSLPKRQIPVFRVASPSEVSPSEKAPPAPSGTGTGSRVDPRSPGDTIGAAPASTPAPTRGTAPASGPEAAGAPALAAELYLGNLSFDVGVEDLTALLGEFGEVESVDFPGHKLGTKLNNGYSFVQMSPTVPMATILDALNGRDLRGRPLVAQVPRAVSS